MTNSEQYNLRKLINNHFFDRDQTKEILENFVTVNNQGVLHVGLPEPTSVALTTPNNAITTADMGTLKATVTGASNVKCYGVPVEFVNKKTQQVLGYGLTDLNGEVYHNFRLDDADIFDVQARLSQDYLFNDFAVLNNTHTWNNNSNIIREIYEDYTKIYLDDDTSYGYLCSPVLSGFVDIDFKVKLNDGAITDTFCGLFTTNSTGTVSGTINGFNLGQLGLTSSDIGRWVDFHIGVLDDVIILLCKDTGAMVKLTHTCPSYYIFCFALTGTLTDLDFRDVKINKCSDDLTMFVKDKKDFIKIYSAENIIQSGNHLDLWCFCTDENGDIISNESVNFYKVEDGVETSLGTAVITDSQGIAHFDYVGSGIGVLNIIAKCRTLQSVPFSVMDALVYDDGTNDTDWFNYANRLSRTLESDGIHIENTSTTRSGYYLTNIHGTSHSTAQEVTEWGDNDFCCEFDYVGMEDTYGSGLVFNDGNETQVGFGNIGMTNEPHHLQLECKNGEVKIYIDNSTNASYTKTFTTPFRFGLLVYNSQTMIFKDWKCYYI